MTNCELSSGSALENDVVRKRRQEESWRKQKSISRHGSFVDGTEYFDNKFFGLSPMEAKAGDGGRWGDWPDAICLLVNTKIYQQE